MGSLVSIIVPCYNHQKYVEGCLLSILDQDYDDIEVIICDDCSKDESYSIIQRYEPILKKKFKNVVAFRHEKNMGVCITLNEMLKMAQGEYIKGIASDDLLTKDAISTVVAYSKKHDYDILFTNAYKIGVNDQYPLDSKEFRMLYIEEPRHGKDLTGLLCAGNYILGASMYFRKDTFIKYGMYDETLSYEDWEYNLRVSERGIIEYYEYPTIYYRMSEGSLSHPTEDSEGLARNRLFYADKLKIFEKYKTNCSRKQKAKFFSQNIRVAIIVGDIDLARQIIREARKNDSYIETSAYIRYLMLKIGIYRIVRSIKKKGK